MKMSSAVDGYSGKTQVGVGGTGAAPGMAQTSEAKQIKTRPSAHNSGRERRAKGDLFFYVYSVVRWTSTGNSPESRRQQLHPLSSRIPRRAVGAKPEEGLPIKTRSTTTLSTPCLVAWLDPGRSARLKRPMCRMCGSARLMRPMRCMGGSVRLKRPMRRMGRIGRCFCRFSGFGALRGCRRRWFAGTKALEGPFPSRGMPIIGA
jgi:hypothetical protein